MVIPKKIFILDFEWGKDIERVIKSISEELEISIEMKRDSESGIRKLPIDYDIYI